MSNFNPSERSVDDVVAYLNEADEAERERVLDAEAAGKNRKALQNWQPAEQDAADAEAAEGDKGDKPEAFQRDPSVDEPKPKPVLHYAQDEQVYEFEQTEENAVHLLAAVKRLGLRTDIVTTNDQRLQAPESVVRAADISPVKD